MRTNNNPQILQLQHKLHTIVRYRGKCTAVFITLRKVSFLINHIRGRIVGNVNSERATRCSS